MGRRGRHSPEVRERAVRMVFEQEPQHESQWAAIRSIAEKIGCSSETLRNRVRPHGSLGYRTPREFAQGAGLLKE